MALPDYTLAMTGTADDGSESVYYHTDTTRELSNEVGDVLYQIRDLEVGSLCFASARLPPLFLGKAHPQGLTSLHASA